MLGINAALHATHLLQPTHLFVTLELAYNSSSSDHIALPRWLKAFILLVLILWFIPHSPVTALWDIELVHERPFDMFTCASLKNGKHDMFTHRQWLF